MIHPAILPILTNVTSFSNLLAEADSFGGHCPETRVSLCRTSLIDFCNTRTRPALIGCVFLVTPEWGISTPISRLQVSLDGSLCRYAEDVRQNGKVPPGRHQNFKRTCTARCIYERQHSPASRFLFQQLQVIQQHSAQRTKQRLPWFNHLSTVYRSERKHEQRQCPRKICFLVLQSIRARRHHCGHSLCDRNDPPYLASDTHATMVLHSFRRWRTL
jgi:hypothetical protein